MMLYPASPWKNATMFNEFYRLNVPDIDLSKIIVFTELFWNGLVWGLIVREGINIEISFSCNWFKLTASCIT